MVRQLIVVEMFAVGEIWIFGHLEVVETGLFLSQDRRLDRVRNSSWSYIAQQRYHNRVGLRDRHGALHGVGDEGSFPMSWHGSVR